MYLHYLDPHGPYEPPRDLYLRFTSSIFPNPVNVYTDVRPNCADLIRQGFGPGEARFEDMVLRYDAEMSAFPREHQRLRDTLQAYVTRCRDAHPQPPTGPTLAPEDVERLRALGYLSDAP